MANRANRQGVYPEVAPAQTGEGVGTLIAFDPTF